MSEAAIVIGIDVAAARPCTAVAVRAGRAARAVEWMEADHSRPDQFAALMAWVTRHRPAVVAVDAPQDFRRPQRRAGGARSQTGRPGPASRVCDRALLTRRISVYQVPSKQAVDSGEARLPEWMDVGFDVFRRLRRLGFEVADGGVIAGMLGGPPTVIEVYPYAAFVTILEGQPPKKTTRAGLHMRLQALRRAGLEWDEYFDHDSLDALAAALTGWRYLQGRATAVGEPREGLIWLPVTAADLRATYAPL